MSLFKVTMDYRVDVWTVERKGGGAVVVRLAGASKLKVRWKASEVTQADFSSREK